MRKIHVNNGIGIHFGKIFSVTFSSFEFARGPHLNDVWRFRNRFANALSNYGVVRKRCFCINTRQTKQAWTRNTYMKPTWQTHTYILAHVSYCRYTRILSGRTMDGAGPRYPHAIDYGMTTKSGFSGIKDTWRRALEDRVRKSSL